MNFVERMFSLKDKTALVTGASGGLGQRFALALCQAGANVLICGRKTATLSDLAKRLRQFKTAVEPIEMDVRDLNSVENAVARSLGIAGEIDILVNCAGIGPHGEGENHYAHTWDSVMSTNARGSWIVSHEVARHMVIEGIKGSIINISSIHGDRLVSNDSAAYCASKAAIIQMTKQLAGDLGQHDIRVNAIVPGLFYTPMTEELLKDHRKAIMKKIPLRRIGDPSDLDGLLLLLASNRASGYITGSTFVADGGESIGYRQMTD